MAACVRSALARSRLTPGFRRAIMLSQPHEYVFHHDVLSISMVVARTPPITATGMKYAGGWLAHMPTKPRGETPMIVNTTDPICTRDPMTSFRPPNCVCHVA